jgi:hypothetical protein
MPASSSDDVVRLGAAGVVALDREAMCLVADLLAGAPGMTCASSGCSRSKHDVLGPGLRSGPWQCR